MQITTVLFILTSVCVGSEVSTAIGVRQNDSVAGNLTVGPPSIGNGAPIKDMRPQCDGSSFGLVSSNERPGIYYLRGVCSGLYEDPNLTRCSYLDLSMCYTNDDGTLKPQKMGSFQNSCDNCALYSNHGTNMLACTCGKSANLGGGTQQTAIQVDNLLSVKNGFLSCYGYTNFECPPGNVPF
ncbi:hypothetical protein F4805DRAFT_224795 [Annulohypoxylon moriforme]|nr:hypothetical protein F4805DRAFT_224795 [Annulohypoxylon moriforme]